MKIYLLFTNVLSLVLFVECSYVTIRQNGPAIIGGTITLTAELFDTDGSRASGTSYVYDWSDNASKEHKATFKGQGNKSVWNVTYPSLDYVPGNYEIKVVVSKEVIIQWPITSQRIQINVTALLNGEILLEQNTTARPENSNFVSNAVEAVHKITMTEPDQRFLARNLTIVRAYWFMDCAYLGMTDELALHYNYTKDLDGEYSVKALVVAEYQPPKSKVNKTEGRGGGGGGGEIFSNDIKPTDEPLPLSTTTTLAPTTTSVAPSLTTAKPYACPDSSFVPMDPNKTYGYFHRTVAVKTPVENVVVNGADWLMHGDILNLTVNCKGTPPYSHCVKIMTGEYNVTGQETCVKFLQTNSCYINMVHYFGTPKSYTFVFIIKNFVSKTVTPFRVNVYEVQKHAQLSVIVVPVTCSVVAVILIVFGVAYYIQSKSRYTVEVADFDFSQGGNDTEYKTFRERLRDAVSSAMNRSQDYSDDGGGGGGGVWSPSRKYGSMQ